MSGAREEILAAVRQATGGEARENGVAREFSGRCAAPRANLVPERGRAGPLEDLVAGFVAEAEAANATVARLAGRNETAGAVAEYLAKNDLPTEIRAAPALKNVSWPEERALTVEFGRAEGADPVGVSEAFCAVAETGTLVMLSGPATPMTLNFLPDVHIVVLSTDRIVGSYEASWTRLRAEAGPDGFMPRAVTWITGPSRSADIELILLLGVHGPRRLHILLIDGETA